MTTTTATNITSTLPPFYFIGGYANSGKSTLISNLEQHFNVLVVSASAEVHHQYRLAHGGQDLDTKQPKLRQRFIDWVEGHYIPSLGGREFFAAGLIDNAIAKLFRSNHSAVVIETVGGEEFDYMMGALPYDAPYRCYNCNREDALPGVDLRVPLGDANELDCNEPWGLWEYRSWFPELIPRLMLPIPDAISRYLGFQVEHSCLAVSPGGGGVIYSLTGDVSGDVGGDDAPIGVDEPTLEKILTNLSALRSGSFEWGCTKIKVTSTGTVSIIKIAEHLGIDRSLFFSKYSIAMELFGYPAGCKFREAQIAGTEEVEGVYPHPPASTPFVSTTPATLRPGLAGNIQLSRQMIAHS